MGHIEIVDADGVLLDPDLARAGLCLHNRFDLKNLGASGFSETYRDTHLSLLSIVDSKLGCGRPLKACTVQALRPPCSHRSGWRSRTGLTASSREARCRTVDSANHGATTCTATGSPSWLVPKRIDRLGSPVTLKGTVA